VTPAPKPGVKKLNELDENKETDSEPDKNNLV
jgi:hypothetical protein